MTNVDEKRNQEGTEIKTACQERNKSPGTFFFFFVLFGKVFGIHLKGYS